MGRVTTEKKSFLDRLQQATQIGTQIAGTIQQGQQIQQRQQLIDNQTSSLELERQVTQQNLEKSKLDMDNQAFEMNIQKSNLETQARASLLANVFQKVKMFGGKPDDKKATAAMKNALMKESGKFSKAFEIAGKPMSGEELESFIDDTVTYAASDMANFQTFGRAVTQDLVRPEAQWDDATAERVMASFAKLQDSAARIGAHLGSPGAALVEPLIADLEAKLMEKNKAVTDYKLNSRKLSIAERSVGVDELKASNPTTHMTPEVKKVRETMGKDFGESLPKVRELVKMTGERSKRALSLLHSGVKTGAIVGNDISAFIRRVAGDAEFEELFQITKVDEVAKIMEMAEKSGARSVDSNAEANRLVLTAPSTKWTPKVMTKLYLMQLAQSEETGDIIEEKNKWVSSNKNIVDFQYSKEGQKAYTDPKNPTSVQFYMPQDAPKGLITVDEFANQDVMKDVESSGGNDPTAPSSSPLFDKYRKKSSTTMERR